MLVQRSASWIWVFVLLVGLGLQPADGAAPEDFSTDFSTVVRDAQAKVVKVYGAGGIRGLEAYQSGILISSQGHILTAWSHVLDSEATTIVLDNGQYYTAQLLGADPLTEIAVLKCGEVDESLPFFDLSNSITALPGTRVLALSNLFGIATGSEAVSVVHGIVSSVAPLATRKGAYSTRYQGMAYVVDAATNNPGAAGGALIDSHGQLLGILGKEVRSQLTNTWLNYALPVESFSSVVHDIREGHSLDEHGPERRFQPPLLNELDKAEHPLQLDDLGIVLVPNVVTRTPPFVDYVERNSSAERAGVRPDDLVVMINHQMVNSCNELYETCFHIDRDSTATVVILREGELLEFALIPKGDE